MTSIRLLMAVISLIAIAIGAWLSYQLVAPPAVPQTATVLPQPTAMPEFELVDQDGAPVTRDDFRGRWSLVFFGFTHCPDVCPLTLQVLTGARRELAASGQEPLPDIVLVSVDPGRDTPEIIGAYVRHFGTDVRGITGSLEELRKLTDGLGIFFQRAAGDRETYLVDHSAVVLLIDPEARFRALFGAPHEIESFVNDLQLILAQR